MKNLAKYFAVCLSAVLPILSILFLIGIDINIYNWLWCGFYGSILILFLCESKIYKVIAIIINAAVISFITFTSLMGGIYGVWIVLMYMAIPFFSLYYIINQ